MNFKKFLFFVFLFFFLLAFKTDAITEKSELNIYVFGKAVSLFTPVIEEKGILLIPAQTLFSRAGFELYWDNEFGQLTAFRKSDNLKIVFTAGSPKVRVGEVTKSAPCASKIYQSNFYVPLNFVTEILELEFNLTDNKILIEKKIAKPVPEEKKTAISEPQIVSPLPQPSFQKKEVSHDRVIFEKLERSRPDYRNFFNYLKNFNNLRVFVYGEEIPQEKIFYFEDELMVSLDEFAGKIEGCQVVKEGESYELFLRNYFLKFYLSSEIIEVGNERWRMPTEARKIKGELYVPLRSLAEYLEMGIIFNRETLKVTLGPRLLALSFEERFNQKILKLSFSHPIDDYQQSYLDNPPRLVLDLTGVVVSDSFQQVKLPNFEVETVRINQFTPDKARVVFDLKETTTYLVFNAPKENEIYVCLGPLLKKVEVSQKDNFTEVKIKTTESIIPKIFELKDPLRLILDFAGVVFKAEQLIPIESGPIERIRGSQLKIWPMVARLVIDLEVPVNYELKNFPEENLLVLLVTPQELKPAVKREKPKSYEVLKGKVIAIDPGHGGEDPGAIIGGIYEKNLTLSTAKIVSKLLNEAGATCLLALEEDVSSTLAERVNFANFNKVDVFISLHFNASYSKNLEGTETYYYKPEDYPLAQEIHQSMLEELRRKDNFVRKAKFYVLTHSKMPAVLIEPVYLTCEKELKLVTDKEFQKKIAQAILEGLVNYFSKYKKKIGK